MSLNIRDARKEDAPFLAKCVLAGMHFYDFEEKMSCEVSDIYRMLSECERRKDTLYSYIRTRVAEIDGSPAGSLLSYPGDDYKELRSKTFREIWPSLAEVDESSEMETGPGEYYLDTLAVDPAFRGHGIGSALIKDGIKKGMSMGYSNIVLIADDSFPRLISLYESLGFVKADRRDVFGVDFQRMIYSSKTAQ